MTQPGSAPVGFTPSGSAPAGFDAVARTALLTTALRAVESSRPDRLYHDPYAKLLAGAAGFALFDEVAATTAAHRETSQPDGPRLPNTADYNAIRTRFLDDWAIAAVTRGNVEQVVIPAAGMDTRAYRLTWPHPVRIFELDRAGVLAHKQAALADHAAAANVARVPVVADLTDPAWHANLVDAGYDPDRPSVWILEGLLYYLAEPDVRRLLGEIGGLCATGSALACDLVNEVALTAPATARLLELFAAWGSPWISGSDEPEKLLQAAGFDAVALQPGEPGAHYGRWQDAVVPRDVPGVPRVFYVHGTRI